VKSSGYKNLSTFFIYLETLPLPSSFQVQSFIEQLEQLNSLPILTSDIQKELRKLKGLASNINQLDSSLNSNQRALIDIRKVQYKIEARIQNEAQKIINIDHERNIFKLLFSNFSKERSFDLNKKDHYLKLNISPDFLDSIANSGFNKSLNQTQIFLALILISPIFSKFYESLFQLNLTTKSKYEALLAELKSINSKFELTYKIYNDATKKYYILKRNQEDTSPIANTIVSSYKYLLELYTAL